MNPIYKMQNGVYVDLDKIVAVSNVEAYNCNYHFGVAFQLCQQTINMFLSDDQDEICRNKFLYGETGTEYNDEAYCKAQIITLNAIREDLINKWDEFKNGQ